MKEQIEDLIKNYEKDLENLGDPVEADVLDRVINDLKAIYILCK